MMETMLTGMPSRLTLAARRRLKSAGDSEAFNDELLAALTQHLSDGMEAAKICFEDLDVAQNAISTEGFQGFFGVLMDTAVRVERLRLFGCPTFNDEVCSYLASWLSTVTEETCPLELHLSDCSITTEGFYQLMDAIEANEAIPSMNPRSRSRTPMYMRLENNYIDVDAITGKVEAGIIAPFVKGPGGTPFPQGAKVKLVVRALNQYSQKTGSPPSPEQMQKILQDTHARPMSAAPGKGSGVSLAPWGAAAGLGAWGAAAGKGAAANGLGAWGSAAGKGAVANGPPAWFAAAGKGWGPAAGKGAAPNVPVGSGAWGSPAGKGAAPNGPGTWGSAAGKALWGAAAGKGAAANGPNAMSQAAGGKAAGGKAPQSRVGAGVQAVAAPATSKGGAAASRLDRSRTPQPTKQAAATGKASGLPHPWEEHWSDEYGIPYYWHPTTGESLWERPTA